MSSTAGFHPPGWKPRLFVDVTTSLLLAGEPPIGISRVEGELAQRLLRSRDPHAIPVVFHGDALFALPEEFARHLWTTKDPVDSATVHFQSAEEKVPATAEHATTSPAARPGDAPRPVAPWLTRRMRWAARASLARLPDAIREDTRIILLHARQIVRTILYARRAKAAAAEVAETPAYVPKLRDKALPVLRAVVHPQPGDVLFTAGLFSHFVPLRTLAEMRRTSGLRIGCVCYDLIRVRQPEFNPKGLSTEALASDIVAMLDAADQIWPISNWTAQELRAFAAENGRTAPPLDVLHLGCDMAGTSSTTPEPAPDAGAASRLPPRLAGRAFALAVSTVEARKNYGLLLRCWQKLVEADPDFPLDLVIVGRPGYGAERSIEEIQDSPLFNKRIFWLDECPDAVLAELYAACHLALYPSFAEGWGLPVSEALAFGREVIASRAGAIPEAARGAATLLDPLDDSAWIAALREAAARPRLTVQPPAQPTWDSAVAFVLNGIRDIAVPVGSKAA